jgi:hydrogenase nickel incorporation protein HypB
LSADVALITKIDLAAAVEFNAFVANRNIQLVRPGLIVLDVSAKSGGSMEEFLDFLRSHRAVAGVAAASQGANVFAAPD